MRDSTPCAACGMLTQGYAVVLDKTTQMSHNLCAYCVSSSLYSNENYWTVLGWYNGLDRPSYVNGEQPEYYGGGRWKQQYPYDYATSEQLAKNSNIEALEEAYNMPSDAVLDEYIDANPDKFTDVVYEDNEEDRVLSALYTWRQMRSTPEEAAV